MAISFEPRPENLLLNNAQCNEQNSATEVGYCIDLILVRNGIATIRSPIILNAYHSQLNEQNNMVRLLYRSYRCAQWYCSDPISENASFFLLPVKEQNNIVLCFCIVLIAVHNGIAVTRTQRMLFAYHILPAEQPVEIDGFSLIALCWQWTGDCGNPCGNTTICPGFKAHSLAFNAHLEMNH